MINDFVNSISQGGPGVGWVMFALSLLVIGFLYFGKSKTEKSLARIMLDKVAADTALAEALEKRGQGWEQIVMTMQVLSETNKLDRKSREEHKSAILALQSAVVENGQESMRLRYRVEELLGHRRVG